MSIHRVEMARDPSMSGQLETVGERMTPVQLMVMYPVFTPLQSGLQPVMALRLTMMKTVLGNWLLFL